MPTAAVLCPAPAHAGPGEWDAFARPAAPPCCPGLAAMAGGVYQLRKRSKADVCEAFVAKLRERQAVDLDAPGAVEGIQQHFRLLPTRYALDVNTDSLDVLNHQRLLDSARADPSAVSFQVRPVDVTACSSSDPGAVARRPSFGGGDGLLSVEVRAGAAMTATRGRARRCCACPELPKLWK